MERRPPRESLPPTTTLAPGNNGVNLTTGRPERAQPPAHIRNDPSFTTIDTAYSNYSSSHPQQQYSPPVALPHARVQFQSRPGPPDRLPTDSSRANLLPLSTSGPSRGHSDFIRPPLHHLSSSDAPPVSSSSANFTRKKSLVRPDRERLDESHRLYNYRAHAAAMEAEGRGVAAVSRTGHYATAGLLPPGVAPPSLGTSTGGGMGQEANLRRGKSILAREEGMVNESGLSMFKRAATLRRPNNHRHGSSSTTVHQGGGYEKQRRMAAKAHKEPLGPWMLFCLALTICCPSPMLKCFGLRTKERQSAWREKMGLLAVIFLSMAAVGYLTFGFTKSVCGTPALRYRNGNIDTGSMIFHGYNYDMDGFQHPAAAGIAGGSNPLYNLWDAAAKDGSFLFQNVNQHCLNVITPAAGTGITNDGNRMGWYFPCNMYNQYGTTPSNLTGYAAGQLCHTQTVARQQFAALKPLGQVYFTWEDLKNSSRNLGVYDGNVLDFSLLSWLSPSQVTYPTLFDQIKTGNDTFKGRDITALMISRGQRDVARCMVDTIRVGFIDSVTIGCVASDIVLYVSLVVIIGVVMLRFVMAVFFGWFWSWRIGKFPNETYAQRMARSAEIENWTDDIYRPAPARYRPSVKPQKRAIIPTTSRFSKGDMLKAPSPRDASSNKYRKSSTMLGAGMRNSPPSSPNGYRGSRSSTSLPLSSFNFDVGMSRSSTADGGMMGACPFPLGDVVPQPPSDYEPFNYPLLHTILLVTAYSESVEGLRTTLDSLATSDYPNSHKVILVIADGMVKGAGNNLTTPEIVLGMMKELVVPTEDVEPRSYVAIADGHKRHNRAKVFAGFYEYDNNTVELSKQQRVPIILVAKIGNEAEANDPKPGNRGKRDSQIVLMAFLQKVMFDERMSQFEYEFFNSMWRCTGVSPDRYETVLCVDADTKVFPDSISRMVSCMVHDPEIMGLCGETKVANKSETWVTMIQVFEYYSAHHLSKAFESVFGGVTCLPGCFSMYRVKAPKGGDGYWVPILANPDIVEHYSENVVDTLHKKNLLLLGEDRYLTTLMLRTFPRRKMMFCPQAVCKTIVPDTFRVLLSQRRRWINSTVHNLFELILVPDLCGVWCFSMRFVIFMELAGTLVLPAAISFTLYLVIVAIIPGTAKPIISLILLAIILGIPGLLIVLTSRKISYVGWMMVYLFSLPIWNLVLPAYAFLHMDDFSWGQTRKIAGESEAGAHGDKDGEFDSSHIVMKRWVEFERDRRYRSGNHSRDSTFEGIQREGSPQRPSSNRYSVSSSLPDTASNSENNHQGPRYPAQLELPAPLSSQGASPGSSTGSIAHYEAPEVPAKSYEDFYNNAETLQSEPYDYPQAGYDSDDLEREAILHQTSPRARASAASDTTAYPSQAYARSERAPRPSYEAPIVFAEPETMPSSAPNAQSPQGRPLSVVPGYEGSDSASATSSRPSNPFVSASASGSPAGSHRRGVSLVDDGPVPGSQGFRTVQRQRRSSQQGNASTPSSSAPPRSRTSTAPQSPVDPPVSPLSPLSPSAPSLPPGAAAPRHSQH